METGTGIVPTMNVGNTDGFGSGSWFWVIILLFFFWGRNGNDDVARESSMNTQFIERDLQGINTNVTNVGTQVLDAKYANAISTCETQKDILLGNQVLGSQMSTCCCEIKGLLRDEIQEVKDLINSNTIQSLRDQLNLAEIASANSVQTQNILNSIGNYYPRVGVNPYTVYSSCGCNGTVI